MGESSSGRELYVMTNPAMPGLVKVGLTTVGAENRADSLSAHAGVPFPFEVVGAYEFPPGIDYAGLILIEREAHSRLGKFRRSARKEFVKASLEDVEPVLVQLQSDVRRNIDLGLTPIGGARQEKLMDVSREEASVRRRSLLPPEPPDHWHVWSGQAGDGVPVTSLDLLPRTYWTKGGARGRVTRNKAGGVYSVLAVCSDSFCSDFMKFPPRKHAVGE